MIFTYSSPAHFQHMQSDAYPTPTIAVWHLKRQLVQQSQYCPNSEPNPPSNGVTGSTTDAHPESDLKPSPQEAINQLIAAAETLAADLDSAQINYVWRSCESIYLQNAAFVK